jgi:hypothetical protein
VCVSGVYTCEYIHIYVCICLYVFICMCIHIHIHIYVYLYTHICSFYIRSKYISLGLYTYLHVRGTARACVCVVGRARVRTACAVDLGVRRLAGVLPSVCLQRGHQQMEHRACDEHDCGMRHFRPAARHRGGRARSDRLIDWTDRTD